MFRIETYCDDKNLPRVLHALMGLVHGQPKIQPVANAKVSDGKVRAKTNGDIPALFIEYLKTHKIREVVPANIKAFAIKQGYAEKSYSFFLSKLIKAKILHKKTGSKGYKTTYVVVKK